MTIAPTAMSQKTIRRLGVLQWVGLLVGAGAWAGQHVVGWGITQAECYAGGASFDIGHDVWQGALLGAAGLCVLAAQAAAILVVLATRGTKYDLDPPPPSRIRYFAIAALFANVLFLMIMLLDGFASIYDVLCRQA
jgi:hypothetical protein